MSEEANEYRDPNGSSEFDDQCNAHRHPSNGKEVESLNSSNPKNPHHEKVRQLFSGHLECVPVCDEQEDQQGDENSGSSNLGQPHRADATSDDEFGKDTSSCEEECAGNYKNLTGEFAHRWSVLESVLR